MVSYREILSRAKGIKPYPDTIGGSALERLSICPVSSFLSTLVRGRASTEAALDGSKGHQVIAEAIRSGVPPTYFIGKQRTFIETDKLGNVAGTHPFDITHSMAYSLMPCWEEFKSLESRCSSMKGRVEWRVSIPSISKKLTGTPDLVMWNKRELHVRDWKLGFMPVDPVNLQNKHYFLGSVEPSDSGPCITDLELVTFGIVQPNALGPAVKVASFDNPLKLYRDCQKEVYGIVEAAAAAALDLVCGKPARANCGSHCHFCDFLFCCPEVETELSKIKEGKMLTDDEIRVNLERAELQKSYVSALQGEVKARLQEGKKLKGWKLGTAKTASRRSFNNEGAVRDLLTDDFGSFRMKDSDVASLRSVADLEKVVGKTKMKALEPYIIKGVSTEYATLEKEVELDF